MQAYCVRERKMVEINEPQKVRMRNGKYAIKGVCNCGTGLYRITGDN